MSNGELPPFELSYSATTIDDLKQFGERTRAANRLPEFLYDLGAALARLAIDPLQWGDSLFRYHAMGLDYCRAISGMLFFGYAVDPIRRIVYIQSVRLLPGQP